MSADEFAALSSTVLLAVFALAFTFGAIVQRTNFCTMGSVADIVSFGDWTRMRQWLLAIAVATLGTSVLAATGVIDTSASFYTNPRFTWLAYIVGGLLFGFGMVLSGGCGSKSLVRAGAGSLKSLVVVCVLGIVAYMTLRGILAVARVTFIEPIGNELAVRQDLPSLLATLTGTKPAWQLVIGSAVALALGIFALKDRAFRNFDNLLAGVGLGAIIIGVWYVSGHVGHVLEHPQTLEEVYVRTNSRGMEALSFVAPVAYTFDYLMFFSDTSKVLTVGIVAVLGVISGSAVHALASGRFRWEGFRDTEDTAHHLVGAAMMGFGGVTALGCTIGQGMSGVSMLAAGSYLALASIIGGAVLGIRYQGWRVNAVESR